LEQGVLMMNPRLFSVDTSAAADTLRWHQHPADTLSLRSDALFFYDSFTHIYAWAGADLCKRGTSRSRPQGVCHS
jgi:hypothetical protein